MKNFIKGRFYKTIYFGEPDFYVGLFRVTEVGQEQYEHLLNKVTTFTGYFHQLNIGENYVFWGYETRHPKYGKQFIVNNYDVVKPEGKDGLIEFLSSDLFPGVGKVTAKKIVSELGLEAIDKIITKPNCLEKITGISKKLATLITKKVIEYEENHRTIVGLNNKGFPMRDSINIYNIYGKDSLDYIEHNIYSLIDDVPNLNFDLVDRIALNNNVLKDDEFRIKSIIVYILSSICFSEGHSYLEINILKEEVEKFLHFSISNENFLNYLNDLEYQLKITSEDNKCYLSEVYEAEENIIKKIKYLTEKKIDDFTEIDLLIEQIEKKDKIKYNIDQQEAIKMSLNNNLSIITGGPGTGKTVLVKAIIEIYKKLNKYNFDEMKNKVSLLAPTGRASKRLTEATNFPAMTIHRFLKWNKDTDQFAVNEFAKNYSHLIIIDEASMIDVLLLNNLFKGLTNKIKVILVGDFYQLPSILPGQLLRDFILSKKIPTTFLKDLYRQSEDSFIPILAENIRKGNISFDIFKNHSDYKFLECKLENIVSNILNLATDLKKQNIDIFNYQIMAPMYRGINGIDNLNKELQKVINPPDPFKKEYKIGDSIFRVGDKVIQLVNVPEKGVYNGDIGIIRDIIRSKESTSKKNQIIVLIDDKLITYESQEFIQLKHAFAISIHKSQGSEVDTAIIPMCLSYNRMLYRKLIYTGITRAKEKLYIIGSPKAFEKAIINEKESFRKSDLLKKIHNI